MTQDSKKRKANEADTLVGAIVGGALLGGALGSGPGAVAGGIIGALLAVLKNEEDKKKRKPSS